MAQTYSFRSALLAQLGGGFLVGVVVMAMTGLAHVDPWKILLLLAMLQGGLAAIIGLRQHAPPWWLCIHLCFPPLVVVVHQLAIEPLWFLGGFLLLLLVFWRTDKSRVPLYLTNRQTAMIVAQLIPQGPQQILDLGCGEGSFLRQLALARPECAFTGIEHAPLTWLLARLRTRGLANVSIRRGNFWLEPLADYRVVYAFLSPAPMQQLWQKLQTEMGKEALFISNSFPVPGVEPVRTFEVTDRRLTCLYLYVPKPT